MQTTQSHVPRVNLSADLAAAVVKMIGERGLTQGMRLDSQRDLAAHFGVAVPTMREALRQLEGMGVLSFRHGSGIYVGKNFARSVVPNIALPPAGHDRLLDLIEARVLIEPAVAAQAARVREPDGIARLTQLLAEAQECLQQEDERLWKINLDLHRAIAQAAGNRIVTEVLDTLLLIHGEDQRQILFLHGDPRTDFDEHVAIVDLIVAGKAEEVIDVMRRHLQDVAGAIRTKTARH